MFVLHIFMYYLFYIQQLEQLFLVPDLIYFLTKAKYKIQLLFIMSLL